MRGTFGACVRWLAVSAFLVFLPSWAYAGQIIVDNVFINSTGWAQGQNYPILPEVVVSDNINEGDTVEIVITAHYEGAGNPELRYSFTPSTALIQELAGEQAYDDTFRFFLSYAIIEGAKYSTTIRVNYSAEAGAYVGGQWESDPGTDPTLSRELTFTLLNGNPEPEIQQIEDRVVGQDSLEFWIDEKELKSFEILAIDRPMDDASIEYRILNPDFYSVFNVAANPIDFTDAQYSPDARLNFVKAPHPNTGLDVIYLRWQPPSTAASPDQEQIYEYDLQVRDGALLADGVTVKAPESFSDLVRIRIHVVDRNADPVIETVEVFRGKEAEERQLVRIVATDVDDQPLTYEVLWGQISPWRTPWTSLTVEWKPFMDPVSAQQGMEVFLEWKPPYNAVLHSDTEQTFSVPILVKDSLNATAQQTVTFVIEDTNQPPDVEIGTVTVNGSNTIPEGQDGNGVPIYPIREMQDLDLSLIVSDLDTEDNPFVQIRYIDLIDPVSIGLPATGTTLDPQKLTWTPGYNVVTSISEPDPNATRDIHVRFTADDTFDTDDVDAIIRVYNGNRSPYFTDFTDMRNTSVVDVREQNPNDAVSYTVQETKTLRIKLEAEDPEQPYSALDISCDTDATKVIKDTDGFWYFVWTPGYDTIAHPNLSGEFTFDLRVTDTGGEPILSDRQRIKITVSDQNQDPNALGGNNSYEKFENDILTINLGTTDPDGDTLTYSFELISPGQQPSSIGSINPSTGVFTWNIPYDAVSLSEGQKDFVFRFKATDPYGGEIIKEITVTVHDVNQSVTTPPEPGGGGSGGGGGGGGGPGGLPGYEIIEDPDNAGTDIAFYRVIETELLAITLVDPDGDTLTGNTGVTAVDPVPGPYTNAYGPATAPTAGNNWQFSWTPTYDTVTIDVPDKESGVPYRDFRVLFTFNDGSREDQMEAIIRVYHKNRPPVIASLAVVASLVENQPAQVLIVATDEDGDPITYEPAGVNPSGLWDGVPSYKTNGNVYLEWTPPYTAVRHSNQNQNYDLTITVNDGQGGSDNDTLTVTVRDVNRAPTFTTFSRIQPTPQKDKSAIDGGTVEFLGADGASEQVEFRLRMSVTDPDAEDGHVYTFKDRGNLPASATIVDNELRWTPGFDDSGTYTFTVRVTESNVAEADRLVDEQQITLEVAETNRKPKFTQVVEDGGPTHALPADSIVQGTEMVELHIFIHVTDDDVADQAGLVITVESGLPANATFNTTPGGPAELIWTPDHDAVQRTSWPNKDYEIEFKVDDGNANGMSTQQITLRIEDVNREPGFTKIGGEVITSDTLLLPDSKKAVEGDPHTIALEADDPDDYDDPALSFTFVDGNDQTISGPYGATITLAHVIEWTPDYTIVQHSQGQTEVNFRVKVSDGRSSGDPNTTYPYKIVTVTVPVQNTNLEPVFTNVGNKPVVDPNPVEFLGTEGATEGVAFTAIYRLVATDPDLEDNDFGDLQYTLISGPGQIDPDTGELTWTPDFNTVIAEQSKIVTFTFEVRDPEPNSLTDRQTVRVEVSNANQPPFVLAVTAGDTTESVQGKTAHTLAAHATENVPFQMRLDALDEDDRLWVQGSAFEMLVPAGVALTSTNIQVQAGQVLFITANDRWTVDPTRGSIDADGHLGQGISIETGIVLGGLLGRIDNGDPFFVGTNKTLTVPANGILYLGPSDGVSGLSDNSGQLTVWITPSTGNFVRFSLISAPHSSNASIHPDSGLFSWTPTYDDVVHPATAGPYTFRFRVEDMFGSAGEIDLTIVVDDVNRAPVVPRQQGAQVQEQQTLRVELQPTDPDGDVPEMQSTSTVPAELNLQFVRDGSKYILTCAPELSVVPRSQQSKSFPIDFTIDDQFGTVNLQTPYTFTLTVKDYNPPPILTVPQPGETLTVQENQTITITAQVVDEENEPINLYCYFQAATISQLGGKFELNSTPPEGITAEGVFTWTPPYGTLRYPVAASTFGLRFYAKDSRGKTQVKDVKFTVVNANQPPEFTSIGGLDPNGPLLFELDEQEDWNIRLQATDPENDKLEFSIEVIGDSSDFGATLTGSLLAWQPSYETVPHEAPFETGNSWQRDFSVVFKVTDNVGGEDSLNGTIRVHDLNRTPVWNTILQDIFVHELQPAVVQLSATDPDQDTIAYNYQSLGSPTPEDDSPVTFDPAIGSFSWTPSQNVVIPPDESTKYQVKFMAVDSVAASAEQTLTIHVTNYNRDPVMGTIDPVIQSVREGETATITVAQGTDPENDPLTLRVNGDPLSLGGTFDPASRTFTWTPGYDLLSPPIVSTNYIVQFTLTDPYGGRTVEEAVITVLEFDPFAGNTPPVIQVQPTQATVPEEQTVTIEVQGSDPDGDTLQFNVSGMPPGATFQPKAGVTDVYLFTWTPPYHVNDPPVVSTRFQILFTVDDGKRGTDAMMAEVIVKDANAAPQILKIGGEPVVEGGILLFQITEGELLSLPVELLDPDGDRMVLNVSGDLTVQPVNGVWEYRPSYNTVTGGGTKDLDIIFTVTDTDGATDDAQVRITVVDRTPRFVTINGENVVPGEKITLTAVEGQESSYPFVVEAIGGHVFQGPNLPGGVIWNGDILQWTPPASTVSRSQGIRILKTDVTVLESGSGRSDQAILSVQVTHVDMPPSIAVIPDEVTQEGKTVGFSVVVTESDGDPYTLSMVTDIPPSVPQPTLSNDGSFTWLVPHSAVSPAQGQQVYQVTFSATDRDGTGTQTVKITVNHVNVPPSLPTIPDRVVSEGQTLSFSVQANDPDGDTLTYSGTNKLNGDQFSWLVDYDTVSSSEGYKVFTFTIQVDDGQGGQDSETFQVRVDHVNRPPEFQSVNGIAATGIPIDIQVVEGEAFAWPVVVAEPDGELMRLSIDAPDIPDAAFSEPEIAPTPPPGGSPPGPPPLLIGNVTLTGTVPYGIVASGQITQNITIKVEDPLRKSDREVIRLIIQHTNRPPEFIQIGSQSTATGIVVFSIKEGESLNLQLHARDPDGDVFSYSSGNSPSWAMISGTVLSLTPGYDVIPKGQPPTLFGFTVEVTDAQSAATSVQVNITVSDVNAPPEMTHIQNALQDNVVPTFTINEGATLTLALQATDGDGDTLTFSADLGSAGGMGAALANDQITWTPPPQAAPPAGSREYVIRVTVVDGRGGSDQREAKILVQHVNQSPSFVSIGSEDVQQGQTILISAKERQQLRLTLKATDVDGDSLTYSKGNTTPAGLTDLKVEGSELIWSIPFTFTDQNTSPKDVSVELIVSDGQSQDTETIKIRVENVNSPPVFKTIGGQQVVDEKTLTFSVDEEDTLSLDVVVEDEDTPYTLSANGIPMQFGATLVGNTFQWQPSDDVVVPPVTETTFDVTFIADDGLDKTQRLIRVRVRDKRLPPENNLPPVFDPTIPKSSTAMEGVQIQIVVSATDANGDNISYRAYFRSAQLSTTGATFDPGTKTFMWTPPESLLKPPVASSSFGIRFIAQDEWGAQSLLDVTIIVVDSRFAQPAPVLVPSVSQLWQNYPNPFNAETWIPYELAADGNVYLTIYNARGVAVRTLHPGHRVAGVYLSKARAAYWDGRNDNREKVASGIYYYHLRTRNFSATRRMIVSQ